MTSTVITKGSRAFPLGATVITEGARQALSAGDVMTVLRRHCSGDWGIGDKAANDAALRDGDRLLSVYRLDSLHWTNIWVITERDRSATTILLPSEY